MTVRVLVVDDQPLFCSGMQLLIDAQPDLAFVGAAHTGDAAVSESDRLAPDVVLMDLRMPDGNGITATRTISSRPAGPRILVLTTFRDRASVDLALQAGASGFITKDSTPGALIAAIRDVAAGLPVFADPTSYRMLSDPSPRSPDPRAIAALTPREHEIYLYVARGLTNPQIATRTHVSENTVRTHVSAILTKLDVDNRHALIHHAHHHGLITAEEPTPNSR